MKKSTLLLLSAALSLTATAQSSKNAIRFSPKMSRAVKASLVEPSHNKTAVAERLKSTASYQRSGILSMELSDSTLFKYSNGRGGVISSHNFDVVAPADVLMFDSTVTYETEDIYLRDAKSATYSNGTRATLSSFYSDDSVTLNFMNRVATVYDNEGVKLSDLIIYTDGITWDTSERIDFAYDGQGRLKTETNMDVHNNVPRRRTTYIYNTLGIDSLITEGFNGTSWENLYRTIYTYTSGNKIATELTQRYDFTTDVWMNENLDSMGYGTNGSIYNYYESRFWNVSEDRWQYSEQYQRTFDGQGRVDVQTISYWNEDDEQWEEEAELKWTYNSNGNPIKAAYSVPQMSIPIEVYSIQFYYEPAEDLKVNDRAVVKTLKVYPNPASDKVFINLEDAKASDVVIVNMLGQQAKVSINQTGATGEMAVGHLQPGAYRISLRHKDGSISGQTLIKQ